MTTTEYLFRSGERIGPEDVPPEVLAELRRLAAADPKRGASVLDVSRWDACCLYSLVLRDGPDESDPHAPGMHGGASQ